MIGSVGSPETVSFIVSHSANSEHGFITFSHIRIKYCPLFQSISFPGMHLSIITVGLASMMEDMPFLL